MSKPLKVIISGGGTGGHVFPAIAIANEIKAQIPDAEILFVGAKGRMEMEKVPAAGYKIHGLWISGIQRKLTLKNLSFPFKLISSIWKVRGIIRRFKPDIAIGVGGYASGPTLHVATKKGIPTLIQEQNSFPGITNRLLAKKVKKICVAYDNLERFFPKENIVKTGNPVRENIANSKAEKTAAIQNFGLDPNKKTLLVIGGSLGARTINQSIGAGLEKFVKNNTQVLWQTGKFYFEDSEKQAAPFSKNIKATAFITEMDQAYAAADVIISRAGAISISELCLVNKPVILVPSPNVSEDHQTKNAMALVNENAAILVKDGEAMENLVDTTIELLKNEEQQKSLAGNIAKLGIPNATQLIVEEVLKLVKR